MSMTVTGIARESGDKDYEIRYEGNTWVAVRHGQKFLCCGVVGTMKELKDAVRNGELSQEPEPEAKKVEMDGIWDCVSPCALVALALEKMGPCPELGPDFQAIAKHTLDCHGWVTPDGKIDRESANRDWDRFADVARRCIKDEAFAAIESAEVEESVSAQQHLIDNDERMNREAVIGRALVAEHQNEQPHPSSGPIDYEGERMYREAVSDSDTPPEVSSGSFARRLGW